MPWRDCNHDSACLRISCQQTPGPAPIQRFIDSVQRRTELVAKCGIECAGIVRIDLNRRPGIPRVDRRRRIRPCETAIRGLPNTGIAVAVVVTVVPYGGIPCICVPRVYCALRNT